MINTVQDTACILLIVVFWWLLARA